MASRNQHVVPHGEGWAVQSEGSARITSVFGTKREAIDKAQEIASQSGVELLVHGRHGQIFRSTDAPGRFSVQEIRDAVRSLAEKTEQGSRSRNRTSRR
jgi:hypothetical protein